MAQDVAKMVDGFLSEDPAKWGKLASDVQFRRLQLLLLREILLELRKLAGAGNQERANGPEMSGAGPDSGPCQM